MPDINVTLSTDQDINVSLNEQAINVSFDGTVSGGISVLDNTVTANGINAITFPNDSITDNGGGSATYSPTHLTLDYLSYDTTYTDTGSEPIGSRFWNSTKGTTTLKTSNDSYLDDGQEVRYYGKASGAIANGEVVQFAGQQGDHILFKVAVPAEIIANPKLLIGIATEDIANGAFGNVTEFGEITMNTTGWTAADLLWWDNTTGQLTNIEPDAPLRNILMAVVQKEETSPAAANGIVRVRISWGQKMSELEDFDGTPLTVSGQIPVWNNDNLYFDPSYNITDYTPTTDLAWTRDTINGYTYLRNLTDRVGIGTASPGFPLHVDNISGSGFATVIDGGGSAKSQLRLRADDIRYRADLQMVNSGFNFTAYDDIGGVYKTLNFNGYDIKFISNSGKYLFQNNIDSTTAFQIKDSGTGIVLNADTTNLRVGIGTTTPHQALDVQGQAQFHNPNGAQDSTYFLSSANTSESPTREWQFGVTGTYTDNTFYIKDNVPNNAKRLIIDNSGNVGINVSPTAKLHVAGTALFQNTVDSTTAFQIKDSAGTGIPLNIDTTNNIADIGLYESIGNGSDNAFLMIGHRTLTYNSNYGIHSEKINPGIKLVASRTSGGIAVDYFDGYLKDKTGGIETRAGRIGSYGAWATTPTVNYMFMGASATTAYNNAVLKIDSTDKIGIGLASADRPTEKLEVNGNIFLTTDSQKMLFGTGKDMSIYYDGTDGYFKNETTGGFIFQPTVDSTTEFQIKDSAGTGIPFNVDTINLRVGIGATNPVERLEVRGTTAIGAGSDGSGLKLRMEDGTTILRVLDPTSSGRANSINIGCVGVGGDLRLHGTDYKFLSQTGGSEYMSIKSGNLGINAISPSERLQVSGNIFLNSDSDKIIFGTGKDMSIYYDGTNGYIKTNEVAASNLNLTVGSNKGVITDGYLSCEQFTDTQHYTGFPNQTDTTLSWDDGTYTLTLTASSDEIWIDGVKYVIDTLTKQLSVGDEATTGLYWFWITAPGGTPQLNYSTTYPGFGYCLTATVYWNTTTSKGILNCERHWMGRDKAMHEYLHDSIGARYASGFAGTFDDTTLAVAAGEYYDEDISHTLTQQTDAKVLYHNGDADWAWDVLTTPYKVVNPGVDDTLRYNNVNSLASVDNQKFTCSWVYVTGDESEPIHIYIDDAQYLTIALARAATPISRGGLTSPEDKLIYKVIYQNDNGTPTYIETDDYRTSNDVGTTYTPTDHGSLSGLTDDDHMQYVLESGLDTGDFVAGSRVVDLKYKTKVFSGTTGSSQGDVSSAAHGVDSTKIVAINALVYYAAGAAIPNSYWKTAGYNFDTYFNSTNVYLELSASNSSSILSKTYVISITYYE